MEVLKIATAGSVDDGKSTLIGRLLYETKSLTSDKLEAIESSSKKKGYDYLDFSLATDGLVAEREQGITIDVAHIYFSTVKRSYIIADTPGHIEYTRNMVTGASTSQVSIILIDARKGIIEQTYRHFFINNLLRVRDVIVAVNKMDLVDFSEDKFNEIKAGIIKISKSSAYKDQHISFVPISALKGDNITEKSVNTPWYNGISLLDSLETLELNGEKENSPFRFPVQMVVRPKTESHHDYRGYAGKVYGGDIQIGDEVTILPTKTTSKVKDIQLFNEQFDSASPGDSVTISLEDDVNISRGDMIVKSNELPRIDKSVNATVCWMDNNNLKPASKYILQHGVNSVLARIKSVETESIAVLNDNQPVKQELYINDLGKVQIDLSKPIFVDDYAINKSNGSFILIDPVSNATAGVGFIG
ncbi:MAG: GTP-binding protein [Crocinitomicaceae bacterium]|nr:GTP-binding protein [Crocinitomicaceae bacterium]